MHGRNNKAPNRPRPQFYNPPMNLADPMLQHITMMALMSRPDIERQLEEAINMIEGITNTIRTMRRGMESFQISMKEAHRHMQSLPRKQAYGTPKKQNAPQQPNHNQQPVNKFNAMPMNESNTNTNN